MGAELLFSTEETLQRVVLVGADTGDYNAEESIQELCELADTAGAQVVGTMLQKLSVPNKATYIGAGKLHELKEFCSQQEVELVIFDDELSGAQIRNIEQAVRVRVIDRTMLILDIFAQRALSREGKLQVELAQQKYMLPRLTGLGTELSRQGGGIGTRGPGETKLETDRRHIRRRIEALQEELDSLAKRRERIRKRRQKNDVTTIAIVGYTNVGKSTLLNLLTDAGVLAKNQLFATLDPTARELRLPDGQKAVVIDTVGLIRRLPHQLVEAFRSTLEEAANADLILNVCDISSPDAEEQLSVTRELLRDLGCGDTPVLTVFNKTDLYQFQSMLTISDKSVFISAKENRGIDGLLKLICEMLSGGRRQMELLVPYRDMPFLDRIRKTGKILSEEYTEDGIRVSANVDAKLVKEAEVFRLAE
ncbi:GTPase HflX [Massiliimalia massiliensis]|uniref:GTPase HflX n=1 Tax=Massiliimalia massiliensis TaxID=1852384 RepID=UPI000984E9B8|nr:GTPase HflX [Massiliimalia massiliensis]MBS1473372.1 GTPase HflX [Massiliimalia sp.]